MPTHNRAAPLGDTDLGWGVAQVLTTRPDTGEPLLVRVLCKACLATMELAVNEAGGVVEVFRHADDCPIYRRIRAHTVHELARA